MTIKINIYLFFTMFCLLGWWWWSCCWCPWTFSLWVSYWRGRDVESIFFDFQQASVGLYLLEQTRIFLLSTKDGMFQFCLLLLQVCILDLEFINGCISHAALGCNLCLGLSQLVSCISQLNNVLEYKIRTSKKNLHLSQHGLIGYSPELEEL